MLSLVASGCLQDAAYDLTIIDVATTATVPTKLSASLVPVEAVTYRWEISSAPHELSLAPSESGPVGTFTPATRGTYAVDRWAALGLGETLTHRFEIVAAPLSPVAVATPERSPVRVGDFIRLDALMSYSPEGLPLTYHWEFVNGSASVPGLPATGPRFEFQTITSGSYTFRLTVRDGKLSATVTISVFASE